MTDIPKFVRLQMASGQSIVINTDAVAAVVAEGTSFARVYLIGIPTPFTVQPQFATMASILRAEG